MSREVIRKPYFPRDPRDPRERRDPRDRERDRQTDYRGFDKRRLGSIKARSPNRGDGDKRRSRSPRKQDKDVIDDNILSEIAKLPEPNELWENNQFQDNSGFPPPLAPPGFIPEPVANSNFPPSYQASYSGVYDDFPSTMVSTPMPPQPPEWNRLSLPPPPSSTFIPNIEDQMKKEAAIESEMRHQKAALSKQREDYIKKSGILKKELDTLKDQRNELRGDAKRSPSPDTKRFLKENTKLQLEIQNKLKTINNVVDMLNGIIGEDAQLQDTVESDDDAGSSKRKSRSPSNKKSNYVYYDPEMHWCRVCNEFPPTAKDYLNHLHSPAHHKMAAQHMEAPWHTVTGVNEGFPSYPSAPTKRTPIRGLQFFVPSTAWYCKLCDQFIGDLHCASAHLKSIVHSKNYSNFVEQNPHWETDWMSDRQKALEKSRGKQPPKLEDKPPQYAPHTITFHKDGFHTKTRKDSPPPPPPEEKKKKDKKKRKKKKDSSSSDSSDSSSSDSEPAKKKKKRRKRRRSEKDKKRAPSESDEKALSSWMSSINSARLSEHDRQLLDTLKSKIKQERSSEDERERNVQATRKLREMERERRGDRRAEPERRRAEPRPSDTERERHADTHTHAHREPRLRDKRPDKAPSPRDQKKPEIRKMPFIGKMPIYKGIGKNAKSEEQKKDDQKKQEEDDATKKRREEMDAEIQKKVAEFKEKIAKAQLEREQTAVSNSVVPLALPTELGSCVPPPTLYPAPPAPPAPAPLPAQPPPPAVAPPLTVPALPKDFQDALDIIFPTDGKKPELPTPDLFQNMPPIPGYTGILGPYPQLLPPQMNPFMNPFEMNHNLFPPRPQLYEHHVPIAIPKRPSKYVPPPQRNKNNKPNQMFNANKKPNQNNNQNKSNENQNQNNPKENPAEVKKAETPTPKSQIDAQAEKEKNRSGDMNREELDDLAMLGIDASDVGAGI